MLIRSFRFYVGFVEIKALSVKNHCLREKAGALLALFYCIACLGAGAQTLRYPVAAPYIGQGAYSYHFVDVFAANTNQAALARLPVMSAGVYAERRFMQEGLNSYSAAVGLPVRSGGLGITANYQGSAAYNESQVGIGYGKKLGQVDLGVRFCYSMMQAAGYGSDGAVTVELGSIWHITDKVHTGIHVYNPAGGKFGKQGQEQLARIYKMGLGYEVSENLLLTAEMVKEEDRPVNVYAGLQYVLDSRFFLRGGVSTAIATPWLAAGWAWKNIRADITASYHPQLGVTPGLLLLFTGKKEQQ
jgi:hypothetical protein